MREGGQLVAFKIDSPEVRISELTMEVGQRWNWEADVVPSIVPGQLAIMVGDKMVGHLDTVLFRIVEYPKETT